MATKRKRVTRNFSTKITPEAVDAFKRGDALRLDRLLGVRPWQVSPADAHLYPDVQPDATPITPQTCWDASVPWARALREELERAIEEESGGR